MKKLLSLALAVVLILGVAVIPASAFEAPNGTALDDCMCDAATIEAIERFNEAVFTDQGFVPDPHIRNWDTSGHLVLIGYDKIHELGIEIDLRTVSGRALYAEYEAKWLAMKNGKTEATPVTDTVPVAETAPMAAPIVDTVTETPVEATAYPIATVSIDETVVNDSIFPDVAPDAWYAEAVNAMTAAGLIKGDGNGNFRPNDAVTYGEFVTILARVADLPTKATESDPMGGCRTYNCYGQRVVKLGYGITPHWAAWANRKLTQNVYDQMIVNIEDLDCNVVRGHALSVIYKTMEYVGLDTTPVKAYTEADIPDWNEVTGVNNGWPDEYVYYIGDHLNFLPDQYVFGLDPDSLSGYSDDPTGYDMDTVKQSNPAMRPFVYAKPENVLAMYNLGIVDGVDAAHTCNPLGTLTRAQLCVLLYRAGLDHVFTK